MKAEIHPDYQQTTVRCVCGNSWETRSTVGGTIQVDICSACHPFYTGKQKLVDTAGRVERFRRRYEKVEARRRAEAEAKAAAKAQAAEEAAAQEGGKPAKPAGPAPEGPTPGGPDAGPAPAETGESR